MKKKRFFSGIQPSGTLHIGNYLGAVKNMAAMQEVYDSFLCVVDLHAVTVPQEPARLRENTLTLFAYYMAAGIDPARSALFIQSHVPAHTELAWILNTITAMGELNRMTQFKDKAGKADLVAAGLFNYPVLMAADILLYDAAAVPVGEDQKQHIELTRDLALRFNKRFGQVFTLPECVSPKAGARIMSLADPAVKMSKSDPNPSAYLSFDDDRDTILKKCKRAVTDSGGEVRAAPDKAGVTNLLNIYAAIKGIDVAAAEWEFAGAGYGAFKEAVGEAAADLMVPLRARQSEILRDKDALQKRIAEGAAKAAAAARPKLRQVYEAVGFVCADR